MENIGVIFRKAVADDLPAIINLLGDDELGQAREDTSSPIAEAYLHAFHAINADINQFLAVAVIDDEISATLQLTFIPGLARKGAWRGQIEAVRVAKKHRSSGLGQQFFNWAIAKCKDKGCHLVQLTTDKTRNDAHRFYDRLGFNATHEGYKLKINHS